MPLSKQPMRWSKRAPALVFDKKTRGPLRITVSKKVKVTTIDIAMELARLPYCI
jgi:hypothetical protein